ncbi:hypothetical protein BGX26_010735 [Mortierella sp. AD094]|nr:hypothetical protein BGX26_010735 [Mortierella sp. AD094]
MVQLSQVLVAVTALVLTAKTADASFGVCVGYNAGSFNTVIGYYLWNQGGDNSHAYDTMGPFTGTMKLSNNNWDVTFRQKDTLEVRNNKYNFDPYLALDVLCRANPRDKSYEGYRSTIYYKCFSTDSYWCSQNEASQKAQCRQWIEMGTDSLSCDKLK